MIEKRKPEKDDGKRRNFDGVQGKLEEEETEEGKERVYAQRQGYRYFQCKAIQYIKDGEQKNTYTIKKHLSHTYSYF